jgi:DNA-directed RNA polymerase sigma subunit (sigma70/sigma32)
MPSADPDPDLDAFRRRAALLLERQRRGEAPPPGEISEEDLAAGLGISRRKLRRLERTALLKLRKALQP